MTSLAEAEVTRAILTSKFDPLNLGPLCLGARFQGAADLAGALQLFLCCKVLHANLTVLPVRGSQVSVI